MPTMPTPALAVVLLLLAASKAASQGICIDPRPSPSAAPAPPTSNTTNSSAFRANVLTLLNALPQAVAPTGFASLSLGTGRDRAFVRGLCRGDTTPSQCLADMQASVFDLRGRCASNRSAGAYYDKAYITFADTNDTINYYYEKHSLEALYDILRVSDPESYNRTYNVLMKSLVARAASEGGNTSAMFATGEAVYAPSDPKGTMYGLVQCMRDLSTSECDWCLQKLVPVLPTCCYGYQGGVARNFNCLLRIQIYTFYDPALDAPPPAAPTPGSPDETRRKTRLQHVILVVAISVATLFVLVVVLAWARQRMLAVRY